MVRPIKCRRVDAMPEATYYKPAGIPLMLLDEVRLSVEELEALRLKDAQGLEQEDGAQRMGVSRPTFQRILASARHKMACALTHGKAIRIEGGVFELSRCRRECRSGHHWDVPAQADSPDTTCPVCRWPGIPIDV